MIYSQAFKTKMVRKMAGPGSQSANALAKQTGICQPTLSRWLRESGKTVSMKNDRPKRPQDWSPEEKLEAVLEAAALPDEDLGGFLRREGLHQTQLAEWRREMLIGLQERRKTSARGNSSEARRVRELERELRRKESALAETAALLVLQKKVRAIWGDGDESTQRRSGK
jgi:transposase